MVYFAHLESLESVFHVEMSSGGVADTFDGGLGCGELIASGLTLQQRRDVRVSEGNQSSPIHGKGSLIAIHPVGQS